jgi:hypothetical protein
MPCAQCSAENQPGAVVCTKCGTTLQPAPHLFVPPLFAEVGLDADRHLEGIGGWLILVAIGLVFSPLVILGGATKSDLLFLTSSRHQPFLQKHHAVHGLILFEVITNLCFVAVLIGLNYLFFKKKRAFPTYMILYLLFHLLAIALDHAGARLSMPSAPSNLRPLVSAALAAAIWVPYYLRSRRVKVTFVN